MGTKTGLNGITFGDATVQNTAAVTGVSSAVAGSGISVSGSTGAVTFTNSGVTSLVAGTGISVSGATGAVTVTASGGGTVTSVATGNGLSGGTITSTGTLVIAAPSNNSVGAYQMAQLIRSGSSGFSVSGGDSYAASNSPTGSITCSSNSGTNNMTGTWRVMSGNSIESRYDPDSNTQYNGNILMVRVS
jgi:hypothetical protein